MFGSPIANVIHEREYLAPISQRSPSRRIDNNDSFNEYSLKQNEFDPSKCSPPNDFILKLQLRMSMYNNSNNNNKTNNIIQSKDIIRVNE